MLKASSLAEVVLSGDDVSIRRWGLAGRNEPLCVNKGTVKKPPKQPLLS